MVNLDYLHEIFIVRYPEWLKFQFHTPFENDGAIKKIDWSYERLWSLLGLRVVNGCPRCTLCGNDLTPNVLRTKNFPVLKHPATARLRRRWYGSSYSACASASMSFRIQHSLRHPNGIFSTRFSSFDTRGGSNSSFIPPLKTMEQLKKSTEAMNAFGRCWDYVWWMGAQGVRFVGMS